MAINLYGNVSGTYQKPNIDLFEMARKQNNQPENFVIQKRVKIFRP